MENKEEKERQLARLVPVEKQEKWTGRVKINQATEGNVMIDEVNTTASDKTEFKKFSLYDESTRSVATDHTEPIQELNRHGFHISGCAFCGNLPTWINEAIPDSHYYLKCEECQFVMKADRRDKVVAMWNRRPIPSPVKTAEEVLNEVAKEYNQELCTVKDFDALVRNYSKQDIKDCIFKAMEEYASQFRGEMTTK